MTRVLLVDDSPSIRAVLRRFLSRTPDLEVVAEASDGAQAVEAVMEHEPQVVLMDLQMPVMDGYTAIERIMALRPTPIVVLTSRANRNQMQIAFETTRRGALEVLPKPEDTDSWNHLAESLPETLRAVAEKPVPPQRRRRRPQRAPVRREEPPVVARRNLRWVAVGASTGGPAAMRDLLEGLAGRLPVTVLLVQHIAPGFEAGLASWLGKELPFDVHVARDGEVARPGMVRLAPTGAHLRVDLGGVLHLDRSTPPNQGHRPSVDELFFSLAERFPLRSAAVLLTGMGSDGVDGLAELRRQGGLTLAQDEASAVVYGMPRVAMERGAAELILPPREIARTLVQTWRGESS